LENFAQPRASGRQFFAKRAAQLKAQLSYQVSWQGVDDQARLR